ncbi:MAG: hypothetical protein RIR00_1328 [Pseudomonadota bacterium]|jgi:putative methyltransferase (TIGR04325 family)
MGLSKTAFAKLMLSRTALGRWCRRLPGLEARYARWALARRDHPGIFSGVYPDYASAAAAIPAWRSSGWDTAESAAIWIDHIAPVRPSTYPVFFWLQALLQPGDTLVDYGGSIGLTYYGYRRRAALPTGSRWVVAEVPHISAQGRQVAEREGVSGELQFVDSLETAPQGELLLAAGALQYMEHSVPGLLEQLGYRPRHILLNKLPLTQGSSFWSLQNFGPSVSPYCVYNEAEFLAYFSERGYRLRDRWQVAELDCQIPFHPEHGLDSFCGLLLERQD